MTATRSTRLAMLMLSALLLVGSGCQSRAQESAKRETSRLKFLSIMYVQFFSVSGGRPPASEQEFKQFIEEKGQRVLERSRVANVDELFVSERDGQPYAMIYGKRPPQVHRDLVGYEQTGVAGKRFVAFTLGNVEEVEEPRFRELVPKQ